MNPRIALGLAVLWLLSLVWVYQFATGNKHNANEAAKVAPLQQAIIRHDEKAVAGHAVEVKAVQREARQEAYTSQLTTEAQRYAKNHPTPATCNFNHDRMWRWAAANYGADLAAAGEPDGPAARADTAPGIQQPGRSAGEPYPGGGDVSPPAGAVPGLSGMVGENK